MSREEWSAFIWRGDRWDQIGTPGDRDHVGNELADWRRDVPDAIYGIGYRLVGDWRIDPAGSGVTR